MVEANTLNVWHKTEGFFYCSNWIYYIFKLFIYSCSLRNEKISKFLVSWFIHSSPQNIHQINNSKKNNIINFLMFEDEGKNLLDLFFINNFPTRIKYFFIIIIIISCLWMFVVKGKPKTRENIDWKIFVFSGFFMLSSLIKWTINYRMYLFNNRKIYKFFAFISFSQVFPVR